MTAPVALMIFNRPDLTERVMEVVKKVAPPMLLVVADGPRHRGEEALCARARDAVVDAVDWDCDVRTNFSDVNLGCRGRLSTGLDWVFSQADEAIVLEDDCLPDPSFFPYCDELLDRYRNDERVMHIGGVNLGSRSWRGQASYRFSSNAHVWGWASWRRAWQHYDVSMAKWDDFLGSGLLRSVATSRAEETYYRDRYDRTRSGSIDTWDYQWQFACLARSGLAIVPRSSLVTNIGFRADATHSASGLAQVPVAAMDRVIHPAFVVRDRVADAETFRTLLRAAGRKQRARVALGNVRFRATGS